jgi:uroporphyrin-III C-methyltransferase
MSEPSESGPDAEQPPATVAPAARARWQGWALAGAVTIALLAGALTLWQWQEMRGEWSALRAQVTKTLAEAQGREQRGGEAREVAMEAVAGMQSRLAGIEERFEATRKRQLALETVYQDLSRTRDEWALAEIEQIVLTASQQLALAGNLNAALAALNMADERLERLNLPQAAGLRKAIHHDIARLEALPRVDRVAISAQLDALAAQSDALPISPALVFARDEPAAVPTEAEAGAWTRFLRESWAELKGLVRVQRVEPTGVPLATPSEAYFLRENLRLRFAGARLALQARDEAGYRADLDAAHDWLERYFDADAAGVAHAMATVSELRQAPIGVAAPEITATLDALRRHRLEREAR